MELIFEWIRFAVGALFLLVGIVVFCIEIYGTFRYKYVLNRMHMSALGDTIGIGFSLIGLVILNGFNFITAKLILVVLFFWCTSPVSGHLISKLEMTIGTDLEEHVHDFIDI